MKHLRKTALCLVIGLIISFIAVRFWPEKSYQPYQPDANYLAQAAKYTVPDLPADWRYGFVMADDGTRIRWGETSNKATAKATIVFVPGFTSTLEMYGDHVRMLAARGYHVVGYDIRGQGGSERHRAAQPEKLYVTDFSVYSDDLAGFIEGLEGAPDKPLLIMASSFGGAVATRAFGDHALKADGLLLLAPAYSPNTGGYSETQMKWFTKMVRLLDKQKHYMPGAKNWVPDHDDLSVPIYCTYNANRAYLRDVIFTRQPDLRVGGVTNGWVIEMIENGETITEPDYAKTLDIPMTLIIPETDGIVNSSPSVKVCNEGFPNCRLVQIPKTGHCLTLDYDNVLNALWDEADSLLAQVK